ncbi:hypothetical protein CAPTEDRAFT_131340, partial [Capitella teleta]
AVDCGNPGQVSNGSFIGSSFTYMETLQYTCDEGFELTGGNTSTWNIERLCLSNKTWSGVAPVCERVSCGDPPAVPNAAPDGSSFLFEDTVRYACQDGYVGTPQNITCDSDGAWENITLDCQRKSCPDIGNLTHGSIQGSSYLYMDLVVCSCNEGFILQGNATLECLSNGSWSDVLPVCQRTDCGTPANMTGASWNGTFLNEDIVTYVCNEGYEMTGGNNVVECLANGTWSIGNAICSIVNCSIPLSTNATLLTPEPHSYGTTAQYECSVGWNHTEGDLIRLCLSDGSWSGTAPVCEVVDCGDPGNATKAVVVNTPDFTYASLIQYECDLGYVLVSGSLLRECLSNGSWSEETPVCHRVTCGHPLNFTGAEISTESFHFGDVVTYTCMEGYTAIGGSINQSTCQANATWTELESMCDEIHCGHPGNISNGRTIGLSYSYLDTITYVCDDGYNLTNGIKERLCLQNSTWSESEAVCELIDCGSPLSVANATVDFNQTTVGSIAISFYCNEGYILGQGNLSRECQSDRTWSGEPPQCIKLSCPSPQTQESNTILLSGDSFMFEDSISYSCSPGFTLAGGHTTRTCQSDGTWSGDAPICVDLLASRNCSHIPGVAHGKANISLTSELLVDTVMYTCDKGYNLTGSSSLFCINGTFGGNLTECLAVTCDAAPSIDNGVAIGGNVYGNVVIFLCDHGFGLVGSPALLCTHTGEWNSTIPYCVGM